MPPSVLAGSRAGTLRIGLLLTQINEPNEKMNRDRTETCPEKADGTTKDRAERAMDAVREVVESEGENQQDEDRRRHGDRVMDAIREIVRKERK